MRKFIYIIIAVLIILLIKSSIFISLPASGIVIDAKTKKPIEGAVIFTTISYQEFSPVHSPTKRINYAYYKTDENGVFHIPLSLMFIKPFYQSNVRRKGAAVAIGYTGAIINYIDTSLLDFKNIFVISYLSDKSIELQPILYFDDIKHLPTDYINLPRDIEPKIQEELVGYTLSKEEQEYTNMYQYLSKQQKEFIEKKFGRS